MTTKPAKNSKKYPFSKNKLNLALFSFKTQRKTQQISFKIAIFDSIEHIPLSASAFI